MRSRSVRDHVPHSITTETPTATSRFVSCHCSCSILSRASSSQRSSASFSSQSLALRRSADSRCSTTRACVVLPKPGSPLTSTSTGWSRRALGIRATVSVTSHAIAALRPDAATIRGGSVTCRPAERPASSGRVVQVGLHWTWRADLCLQGPWSPEVWADPHVIAEAYERRIRVFQNRPKLPQAVRLYPRVWRQATLKLRHAKAAQGCLWSWLPLGRTAGCNLATREPFVGEGPTRQAEAGRADMPARIDPADPEDRRRRRATARRRRHPPCSRRAPRASSAAT